MTWVKFGCCIFLGCFYFLKEDQIVHYFNLSLACGKQGKVSQAGNCHMLWCVLGISRVRSVASCVVCNFVCLLWKTSNPNAMNCDDVVGCSWKHAVSGCSHQLRGGMPVWLGLFSECWELAVRSVKLQGFLLVPPCCRSKVMQEILPGQIKAHSRYASVASLCLPHGGQRDRGISCAVCWPRTCASKNLFHQFHAKFSVSQEDQAQCFPLFILANEQLSLQ